MSPTGSRASYARALLLVPGRDLERSWFERPDAPLQRKNAWLGLYGALGAEDPRRLEAMIERGVTLPAASEHALHAKVRLTFEEHHQGAAAMALSEEALRKHLRSELLVHQRWERLMMVGRFPEAEALRKQVALPRLDGILAEYAHDVTRSAFSEAEIADDFSILDREVMRLVEHRDLAGAERWIEKQRKQLEDPSRSAALVCLGSLIDLIVEGTRIEWVEAVVRRHLMQGPRVKFWPRAAGAFARSSRPEIFDRWFDEARRVFPLVPWLDLTRALFLARCGRTSESVQLLRVGSQSMERSHAWLDLGVEVLVLAQKSAASRGEPAPALGEEVRRVDLRYWTTTGR